MSVIQHTVVQLDTNPLKKTEWAFIAWIEHGSKIAVHLDAYEEFERPSSRHKFKVTRAYSRNGFSRGRTLHAFSRIVNAPPIPGSMLKDLREKIIPSLVDWGSQTDIDWSK